MPKYLIQDIIPPHRKGQNNASHGTQSHAQGIRHHAVVTRKVHSDHANRVEDMDQHHEETKGPIVTNDHVVVVDRHSRDAQQASSLSAAHVQIKKRHSHGAMEHASHETDVSHVSHVDGAPQGSEKTTRSWQTSNRLFGHPFVSVAQERNQGKGRWWWILGIVGVVVLFVAISPYFTKATVNIIAKKDKIPMEQKFTAVKLPVGDALPYAVMTISESVEREVPAAGTKTVSSKASGQIIVYNEQTVPQRLIKNTRFESPKGLIYRINDSITIPKASTQNGKLVPGSLTVTVYADEPGPEYNTDPVDFTVPGLKGGPLYTKVYARSKGAITGGALGTAKVVRDADLKTAEEELRVAIETKLRNRAHAELSLNQIAYDGSFVIEIGKAALTRKTSERDANAIVEASGRLAMVVLDRTKLTHAITRALLPTWKGEPIEISNLESIEMRMDRTTIEALEKDERIEFILKGTPEFRWIIDEEGIKKTLSGVPKSRFDALVRAYPTIERATASLSPFWNRSFPDDPSKIHVIFGDTLPER